MVDLDSPLLLGGFKEKAIFSRDFQNLRRECGPGGVFFFDVAKKVSHTRLIARNGEWSLPWSQVLLPGYEMPAYQPGFSKSFSEVTDDRAREIRERIRQGERFSIMYSGGLDSTLVLAALLKNVSIEELRSVSVCTSPHSLIENPEFWQKHVQGKLKVHEFSGRLYDQVIKSGNTPITADQGDSIFGTIAGPIFYNDFDFYLSELSAGQRSQLRPLKNKIESDYTLFKELLVRYFALGKTPEGLEFGRLFYEKIHRNILTSSVPVRSLHDFFWWFIFNLKYVECGVRGAINWNSSLPVRQCLDSIVNWYGSRDYQLWSMANNNNGTKIRKTVATYKYVLREYIYEFDKNEWYFYFKTKVSSLRNIRRAHPDKLEVVRQLFDTKLFFLRNISGLNRENFPFLKRFGTLTLLGLDSNYQRLWITDQRVHRYFRNCMINYKIDWA